MPTFFMRVVSGLILSLSQMVLLGMVHTDYGIAAYVIFAVLARRAVMAALSSSRAMKLSGAHSMYNLYVLEAATSLQHWPVAVIQGAYSSNRLHKRIIAACVRYRRRSYCFPTGA